MLKVYTLSKQNTVVISLKTFAAAFHAAEVTTLRPAL